ncbi:methyltransferase [Aureimonas endophytica]|uniref:Methyltransferase n=1 Tax=Aureimonas endophytica TaxID=2027858 RepID=A0A916ZFP4_9HYPH|nr:methyltransferase domain-containing protein [Aureimonas endophytica]GGD94595.1 methyltransferase [Aureimonas endophytica]
MPLALSSNNPRADQRAAYAQGYAEGGDFAAAADLMRQALELAPDWAAGWTTLALHREKAGDREGAIAALRQAVELDPADGLGAGAKLAALGEAPPPSALPPAFVRGLFDQYAERFEQQLRDRLAYRAPELLGEAIRAAGPGAFAAVLDLGCGTGLMGTVLRPLATRLVGLDLSPAMLAKARAKGVYDALHESDILAFAAEEDGFDLVVAADVLNYLGDLAPVFARARRWLRPGGLLAFTLEAHAGAEPFVLRETLRYAHAAEAVSRQLAAAGFAASAPRHVHLREDRGEPVEGLIFTARG